MNSDHASGIPGPRKPLTVYWIDTLQLQIPFDITSMEIGSFVQSGPYDLPLLEDKFFFQVSKVSMADIMVTCIRFPADPKPDPGYLLRFYISVISINEGPKSVDMHFNEEDVSVFYQMNSFFQTGNPGGNLRNYFYHLKIIVRMIEYEPLQNERRALYESFLEDIKLKFYKSEERRNEMAFLLRRPGFENVFSGRQNDVFASNCLGCIARAAPFAEQMAQYVKAVASGDPIPNINFRLILNYILNEKNEPISNEEAIVAFLRSYRLGLNFVKVISTTFMVNNLNNDLDFVIDVIQAADLVDDPLLFRKSADIFVANLSTILSGAKWNQIVNNSVLTANSIIHAIRVRLSMQELYVPPPTPQFETTG